MTVDVGEAAWSRLEGNVAHLARAMRVLVSSRRGGRDNPAERHTRFPIMTESWRWVSFGGGGLNE